MLFSLLNVQTLLDDKLPELFELTQDDHISFFTELNIRNSEHRNVVTSEEEFVWKLIPEDQAHHQRIGLRYPVSLKEKLKIEILKYDYLTQERSQKDKCSSQYMLIDFKYSHLNYRFMLVYRAPDSDDTVTESIFEMISSLGERFNMKFS